MTNRSLPRHPNGPAWLARHRSEPLPERARHDRLSVAATNRLAEEGYGCPFLGTEDFRTEAIAIYLNLGWQPYPYADRMEDRWDKIIRDLGWAD